MCMISTEESNNKSARINADSMICEKNKELKSNFFPGECSKLCSSKNRQMTIKGGLKHKKIQHISKITTMNYHLQKNKMFNTWILSALGLARW